MNANELEERTRFVSVEEMVKRITALEAENAAMREALKQIASLGTDCSPEDTVASFVSSQLIKAITIASHALSPPTGKVPVEVLQSFGTEPKSGEIFLAYRRDAGFMLCLWKDDALFTAWGEDITNDPPSLWADSPIESELVLVDREKLREIEWPISEIDGGRYICAVCGKMDEEGHADDCWLAALLKD